MSYIRKHLKEPRLTFAQFSKFITADPLYCDLRYIYRVGRRHTVSVSIGYNKEFDEQIEFRCHTPKVTEFHALHLGSTNLKRLNAHFGGFCHNIKKQMEKEYS